ncbi:MAG: hypothetical protein ACXVCY_09950 [Pseudobdellovibrionaceae bacterium]
MKKLFASFVVSASALMLISCGSNNSDPNYYGYGYAAPPVPTCPVNTVWNGTACVNSTGVAPTTGPAYFYDYKSYYYQNVFGFPQNGDLVIVDTGAYQQFLKEAMGVCDRNIWGWQAGLADCANWVSGSFIVQFSIDSTLKPSVSFTAYPGPTYYSINFGLNGGGAVLNPLVLSSNNTFSLINNSHGFEIRAQGSYWNGGGLRLIQIQVANGTLNDGYFNFDLYYPYNNVATKIASGKFKRR